MTAQEDALPLSDLIDPLERHWSIGRVTNLERIKRGLVNQTFCIDTQDGQSYILRLYHPDITPERIRQEHALLTKLERVSFEMAPRLVAPVTSPTWITLAAPHSDHRHMALMTRLPGEDRYRWDAPPQSVSAAVALGENLARYHQAVWERPPESVAPASNEAQILQRLAGHLENDPLATATLEPLVAALTAMDRRSWPALMVHGDYHAANVRWCSDPKGAGDSNRICGIFDFEYAALNWRLYDVGMAGAYLATAWEPANQGALQPLIHKAFLDSYQSAFSAASPLPPLQTGEWDALPHYLALAHLLTLEWALTPGARKRLGAATANGYTHHARCALDWLQQNEIFRPH